MPAPKRLIAPAILLILIAAAYALGLGEHLSWAALAQDKAALQAAVANHPIAAPLIFVLVYVTSVTLSLPQAVLLTLMSGVLFGTAFGGSLAVTGATIGAICLFLIARSALGGALTSRGGAALTTLRQALARDGFSYLLAIRLIPVVPFWLVNLAAAACGIGLAPFAAATLIGVIPATFIVASIGAGLSGALTTGEKPDLLAVFLSAHVLFPLLGLAVLSLAPVIWRKFRGTHA